MDTKEINIRYSKLAEDSCCLSCGGAIDYAEPQLGEICVDLGSGRGTDVLRMAEKAGEEGFAFGIDISEGMITKANKNAKKTGVDNVRFIQSELEAIDLPSNTADLVISNCTINHAQNKYLVWMEVHRILKPGGRFVVSDIYSIQEVPEEYRNDPQAVAECWAGAVTREEYMETLESVGYTDIKVLEESAPYDKGEIQVSSFTVYGKKRNKTCNCCSN